MITAMFFALAIVYFALLLLVILFLAGASRLSQRAEPRRPAVGSNCERIGRFIISTKHYRDAA